MNCCCQAILPPEAAFLIAHTVIGSGKTVKIPFVGLDHSDQFGFLQVIGFDTVRFCNRAYTFQFHDALLKKAEQRY